MHFAWKALIFVVVVVVEIFSMKEQKVLHNFTFSIAVVAFKKRKLNKRIYIIIPIYIYNQNHSSKNLFYSSFIFLWFVFSFFSS